MLWKYFDLFLSDVNLIYPYKYYTYADIHVMIICFVERGWYNGFLKK